MTFRLRQYIFGIAIAMLSSLAQLEALAHSAPRSQIPLRSQQEEISCGESCPGLEVPGNAPVYYCSDPDTDLFRIDSVDIIPYPPVLYVYEPSKLSPSLKFT